jgi:hypothetical protein
MLFCWIHPQEPKAQKKKPRTGITFYATFLISCHLEINPDILATLGEGPIMCLEALDVFLFLVALPLLVSSQFKPKRNKLACTNANDHG